MQFFGTTEINPSPPAVTAGGNNAHMMYIFNRNGVCLLYREWNRPLRTLNVQQDQKLMFGLLFSLKSLTAKMDPIWYQVFLFTPFVIWIFGGWKMAERLIQYRDSLSSVEKVSLGVPQLPGQGCAFHSFRTNTYKLSFMETPSGIKVKECELFNTTLDQYVRGLG
ncbi:hypothetical protein Cgig2_033275 [Carnegiea gigantea]|uniref:Trafficking protein particle complex subunit n=1 Tax=Carnegiea gigantea TaxID=171969 RepID=A0A9Q1KWG0_9CARY|nr:hypothetical protein Cgig2_033275 [Carnegiea gigantea]